MEQQLRALLERARTDPDPSEGRQKVEDALDVLSRLAANRAGACRELAAASEGIMALERVNPQVDPESLKIISDHLALLRVNAEQWDGVVSATSNLRAKLESALTVDKRDQIALCDQLIAFVLNARKGLVAEGRNASVHGKERRTPFGKHFRNPGVLGRH